MTLIHWWNVEPSSYEARLAWDAGVVIAIKEPVCLRGLDPFEFRRAREDVEYKRKPKGQWQTKPLTVHLRLELCALHHAMQETFTELFATLGPPAYSQFTFRPTITRGETHKDKEKGTVITAFINLDDEDRVWKIEGEEVRFPPKALWIFQAEKIEHQVIYGRCCAQLNWKLIP